MKREGAVSTLDLVIVERERRCGNSTRMIDAAIQSLFYGDKVAVRDHFKNGECRESNARLLRLILDRLWHEHRITDEKLNVDWNRCLIKFR